MIDDVGDAEEVIMPDHVEWSDNPNVQIGRRNSIFFRSINGFFRWNLFTQGL